MPIGYTREELVKLNVGQLKRLCAYFDIEVLPEWKKAQMIKALIKHTRSTKPKKVDNIFSSSTSAPAPLIKSVRIERIEESMKG